MTIDEYGQVLTEAAIAWSTWRVGDTVVEYVDESGTVVARVARGSLVDA